MHLCNTGCQSLLPGLTSPTHLVSHLDEAPQCKFQYHVSLEGDKVTDILKDEEPRAVVITIAEVGDH